jgi:IS30 family transposase
MNRLSVSLQQSIFTLYERGWSARRIARELGVHRETVGGELQRSKPAKVTPGSGEGRSEGVKLCTLQSRRGEAGKEMGRTGRWSRDRPDSCRG